MLSFRWLGFSLSFFARSVMALALVLGASSGFADDACVSRLDLEASLRYLEGIKDCDSQFYPCADNLKDRHGRMKEPEPTVVRALTLYRAKLNAIADQYGVNPLAIAGAIVGENSLNVSLKDELQDQLARIGGTEAVSLVGRIFQRPVSVGLGQINEVAVGSVEPLRARIEGRPVRDLRTSFKDVTSFDGSVRIVAAIIRKAQDDYSAQGLDVSKSVGVLVTLFNLGDTGRRAVRSRRSGQVPGVNYLGWFAEKNLATLCGIVGR